MQQPSIRATQSRVVYRNAWMSVREDDVVRADGSTGTYGVVDKPDFALVVPWQDGSFHLVEQYRYPVSGRFWEFPQGSWSAAAPSVDAVDGDEEQDLEALDNAFALAVAELREETGLRAKTMTYLGRIHVAYGFVNQGCHVFLAEDLTIGEPEPEASEADMRQMWVSLDEWAQLVQEGLVTDAATLAAYALFCLHLVTAQE